MGESAMGGNRITFRHNLTAAETRIFEEQYEENLQLEDADKDFILQKGLTVWMYVDNPGKFMPELAGESYGIMVKDDEEVIEDTADLSRQDNIYCYSTTILPRYRGLGYANILKAYWLGYVRSIYPKNTIIGHSTSLAMKYVNEKFGATHLAVHRNWYGTDRTAWFYEIKPS